MTTAGHIHFSWKSYIDFAEELINGIPQDSENETVERCGISRAYYGVFNVVRNYLKRKNQTIDLNGKGSHEKVIGCVEDFGRTERLFRNIALELRNLKALRISADYNDKFFSTLTDRNKILKKESKLAVLKARNILKWLDKIEENELA